MTMKRGAQNKRVRRLQKRLADAGHEITADGVFGPQTEAAVRAFQESEGLLVDGIAGPRTLKALDGVRDARDLTEADIRKAADRLNVDVATVHAVAEVESRGDGFFKDGRPALLFERHIMKRQLSENGINPEPYQEQRPDLVNSKPGGYLGGVKEHHRLGDASGIHPCAAVESASWGRFQIMGFHWEHLGFASASAFRGAMECGEGEHLQAFASFVLADEAMHAVLKERDWAGFAERYNGPNYRKNRYDEKLKEAYQRHSRAQEES